MTRKQILFFLLLLVVVLTACNNKPKASCIEAYFVDRDFGLYVDNFQPIEEFEQYFESLNRTDATGISKNKKQTVGKIKLTSLEEISSKEIFLNLINSNNINTFWHLSSSLCLEFEEESESHYQAFIEGSHEYCTNKCKSDELAFIFEINKSSGDMIIIGK